MAAAVSGTVLAVDAMNARRDCGGIALHILNLGS